VCVYNLSGPGSEVGIATSYGLTLRLLKSYIYITLVA